MSTILFMCDVLGKEGRQRDVRERVANAADVGRRLEIVLLLRDLGRNRDRVAVGPF